MNQCVFCQSERHSSRKVTVEDLTDDAMREVRAQTVTPAELSQLIIHLVQDLCRSESPISTSQICLQAVNFALENLCSLQFGSTTVDALSPAEVSSPIFANFYTETFWLYFQRERNSICSAARFRYSAIFRRD